MRAFFLYIFICLVSFVSCDLKWYSLGNNEDKNVIEIRRFDKLLSDYVETGNFSLLQKMKIEYPVETKILIENVLQIGKVNDVGVNLKLRAYYSDSTLTKVLHDVGVKFKDVSEYENQLSTAFERLHSVCPKARIPRVYTFVSAFNQSVVVSDTLIGISLDKYLGENYRVYEHYFLSSQITTMRPERIVPDCLQFYLASEFPEPSDAKKTLLSEMINVGKRAWIIARLTDTPLSESLGLDGENETLWEENSKIFKQKIHSHGEKILYSKDKDFINKVMFLPLSKDKKGYSSFYGCGIPLGCFIVDAYMKANLETSVCDLLKMHDAEKILKDSGFQFN